MCGDGSAFMRGEDDDEVEEFVPFAGAIDIGEEAAFAHAAEDDVVRHGGRPDIALAAGAFGAFGPADGAGEGIDAEGDGGLERSGHDGTGGGESASGCGEDGERSGYGGA